MSINKKITSILDQGVMIFILLTMLLLISVVAYKWYLYFTGQAHYVPATPTVMSVFISVIAVVSLFGFILITKEKKLKRYILALFLLVITGNYIRYYRHDIYIQTFIPLIEVVYYSLFCLVLVLMLLKYNKAIQLGRGKKRRAC